MDREIKFRVYDLLRGKIVSPELCEYYFSNNQLCIGNSNWAEEAFGNYPIMQYTGLKDKNGKEIYEGDIVKLWFDEGEEVFWNSFLVKFFEGCFICEFLGGDTEEYPISEYWNDSQDLEVIGNIYENPELLTNN